MTTTPVEWLDRARVAEARVAELEAELARVRRRALVAHQRATGCNQDDDHDDWGVPCCASCVCAQEVEAALGAVSDAPSLSALARAVTLEECAELAQEFGWILPLRETAEMNEAMDDAACDVARQIAEAIRAKAVGDG